MGLSMARCFKNLFRPSGLYGASLPVAVWLSMLAGCPPKATPVANTPAATPPAPAPAPVKPPSASAGQEQNPKPKLLPLFAPKASTEKDPVAQPDNYVVVIYVNFEILRTRVPKGTFSASGKIWNHLDEEAIPAETAALLQRNGLRAGRGGPDSWPPIKALLEQEKSVETSRTSTTVGNGLPLSVNVDQHRYRDQTLFLFRRDGTLGGATFPMSTNYLRIEHSLPAADPSEVVLEVCPEFREQQTLGALAMKDGMLEQPIQEPTRILRELAFRMPLRADQFCAVGPAAATQQGHLAGSLLLGEELDGKAYESMYFITPHVYRTDRPKAP